MGGGGQHADEHHALPSPPRARSFRHRRRGSTGPGEAPDSGLDLAPSVSYPSLDNQACRLDIQTSQYLCTLIHPSCKGMEESIPAGTAPCDPIVAFGRYVVSATDDGRVCFYSIRKQLEPCSPVITVEIDDTCTITGLVAAPAQVSLVQYRSTSEKDRILSPPSLLGHVVVITSEGDVHIIECEKGQEATKLCSWNTGTCSPSCVTVRPDCTGQWRISLGYESGCLQEWQVFIPVRETSPPMEPRASLISDEKLVDKEIKDETETATPIQQVEWKPFLRRSSPKLMFQGFFDLPIRSVASLGTESCGNEKSLVESKELNEGILCPDLDEDNSAVETTDAEDAGEAKSNTDTKESEGIKIKDKTDDHAHDTRDYLAVCLVMNPQSASDENLVGRPTSASQIEVIGISTLERDWNNLREEQDHKQTRTKVTNPIMALPLSDYCVWPHMGMEILDTSSLPAVGSDGHRRLSRRMRGLPSSGSDRMCSHDGSSPFFAAVLSDGTAARMRSSIENGTLRWGVQNDCDQVTLSFPAIGIAPVRLLPGGDHIACCLRGGTVYLVPDSKDIEPIVVILGSVDMEEEDSTQYLQGFTAGNIRVEGSDSRTESDEDLAILIYSSAGGVLKVHSCSLLSSTEHDNVLNELVENGSVRMFRDLVCSLEDNDPLVALPNSNWMRARDEIEHIAGIELTFKALRSPSMAYTRQILLELSMKDGVQ